MGDPHDGIYLPSEATPLQCSLCGSTRLKLGEMVIGTKDKAVWISPKEDGASEIDMRYHAPGVTLPGTETLFGLFCENHHLLLLRVRFIQGRFTLECRGVWDSEPSHNGPWMWDGTVYKFDSEGSASDARQDEAVALLAPEPPDTVRLAAHFAANLYLNSRAPRTLKSCMSIAAEHHGVPFARVQSYLAGVGVRALLAEE